MIPLLMSQNALLPEPDAEPGAAKCRLILQSAAQRGRVEKQGLKGRPETEWLSAYKERQLW
jgi:hypothetical protein